AANKQRITFILTTLSIASLKQPSLHLGFLREWFSHPHALHFVIGMITTLFVQCMTGLVIAGFFDAIPGSERVITDAVFDVLCTVHGIAARMLVVFVVLHLVAIIIYKLRSKPLVLAMITGKQNHSASTDYFRNGSQLAFSSNRKALLVLIASVLVTMTIVVISQ
ncbi:cytochrome b/b6 domain-containing protein, partial [Vibrio sp. SG41-7]|uniref:cytochrome b/b6 domain-containing protein n=1 Tax=Vibrio sp. SG41-7 TaxID=2760973 RepID=UPI002175C77A